MSLRARESLNPEQFVLYHHLDQHKLLPVAKLVQLLRLRIENIPWFEDKPADKMLATAYRNLVYKHIQWAQRRGHIKQYRPNMSRAAFFSLTDTGRGMYIAARNRMVQEEAEERRRLRDA